MIARIATVLVIASQLILIWVSLAPNGRSASIFMFVGHPLVFVGSALGVVALTRRLLRERALARAAKQQP